MKILFVCTDNTCRSPMAKAVFDQISEKENLDVSTDSAGIAAAENEQANPHAVEVMAEAGMDISGHKTKNITTKMLSETDYIIVMSQEQKDKLCAFDPHLTEKVRVLKVDDPTGHPIEAYRSCLCQIRERLPQIARL